MPRDQRNLPGHLADDATFRAWASGVHAQILAVGMVDVTNAPLDFATATRPAASTDSDRVRVYRFPDTDPAQAAFPIFLRVAWGGGASADRPRMRFRVGTGVNASNAVTGQIGHDHNIEGGISDVGAVWPSFVSAQPNEGRFAVCNNLRSDVATRHITFYMERNRGADNAVASDGLFTWSVAGQASAVRQMIPRVGSVPAAAFGQPGSPVDGGGMTLWGNDVALVPLVSWIGRPWILRGAVGYRAADISEQQAVAAEHMGAARTFMPLGARGPEAGSGSATAIAWDA